MKLQIVESEKRSRRALNELVQFDSSFELLSNHNGLRKNKLHIAMGTSGSGKSTFVRSVLLDLIKKNPEKRILVFLTEETVDDFKDEMSRTQFSFDENCNLFVESDQTHGFKTVKNWFLFLEEIVLSLSIDLLIIDNITTFCLYNDQRANIQSQTISYLKRFTQSKQIATLMIAHTNSEVNDNCHRLINENDIRGSKSVINFCEFIYILQRFDINGFFYPTVRIKKARGQDPKNLIFLLKYNSEQRLYLSDLPITFKEFKDAYDKRNKL